MRDHAATASEGVPHDLAGTQAKALRQRELEAAEAVSHGCTPGG